MNVDLTIKQMRYLRGLLGPLPSYKKLDNGEYDNSPGDVYTKVANILDKNDLAISARRAQVATKTAQVAALQSEIAKLATEIKELEPA